MRVMTSEHRHKPLELRLLPTPHGPGPPLPPGLNEGESLPLEVHFKLRRSSGMQVEVRRETEG